MIKSIKFPKQGEGYLYTKPENPGKAPNKESYEYSDWDFSHNRKNGKKVYKEEKFARDYEQWEKEKKYYDDNKGKFINPAAKTLIGKEFDFEPGKLNIIFGPNGCGKTTILKAIAGTAGIVGDGMTHPGDPLDVFGWDNDRESIEAVAKHIEKLKQNTADVVWDGNVVYYDNFAHTFNLGNSFIPRIEHINDLLFSIHICSYDFPSIIHNRIFLDPYILVGYVLPSERIIFPCSQRFFGPHRTFFSFLRFII